LLKRTITVTSLVPRINQEKVVKSMFAGEWQRSIKRSPCQRHCMLLPSVIGFRPRASRNVVPLQPYSFMMYTLYILSTYLPCLGHASDQCLQLLKIRCAKAGNCRYCQNRNRKPIAKCIVLTRIPSSCGLCADIRSVARLEDM
jgi:hypothetical protein